MQTRRADRILTCVYDSFIKKRGLKSTQYGLLLCIRGLSNPCMSAIGNALSLDQTTVTRNMDKLYAGAYVLLELSETVNRRTRLKLTPPGYRKLAEAKHAWESAQNYIKSQFSKEEFEILFFLLDNIIENPEKED